jgi:hypothetical protein
VARYPEPFWDKVELNLFGCWLWQGAQNHEGYGLAYGGKGKQRLAHRLAWELTYTDIPVDKVVRHKCDTRLCVRLDHLELGTIEDNNWDTVRHGNHHWAKRKACSRGHAYTEETMRVRIRKGTNRKYRVCLICQRENHRRYKRKGKDDAEDCNYED